MQYLVGHFLMLLLVGVAGALDEEQTVLGGGGHVRVDVAVDAGDGYQHRVGLSVGGEQHAVEQYASLCFYLQFFHISRKITTIPQGRQIGEY